MTTIFMIITLTISGGTAEFQLSNEAWVTKSICQQDITKIMTSLLSNPKMQANSVLSVKCEELKS